MLSSCSCSDQNVMRVHIIHIEYFQDVINKSKQNWFSSLGSCGKRREKKTEGKSNIKLGKNAQNIFPYSYGYWFLARSVDAITLPAHSTLPLIWPTHIFRCHRHRVVVCAQQSIWCMHAEMGWVCSVCVQYTPPTAYFYGAYIQRIMHVYPSFIYMHTRSIIIAYFLFP